MLSGKRTSTILLAAIVALSAGAARAADVPTWQPGDWWDMARTFDLSLSTTEPLDVAASLIAAETFRLTVAEIADKITTQAGVVRSYRRTRSAGTITGTGSANISGIPVNLRFKPGGTTAGEDWTAVGDLARVREQFSLTASLQAQVLIWLDLGTVTLDVTLDVGPPHEMLDFPLLTVGEQWQTTVTQHLYGHIQVTWNPNFPIWPGGSPPENIDEIFDRAAPSLFRYHYLGREAHGPFPEADHIDVEPTGDLWYAPAIKEFAEIRPGNLDFGGGNQLANIATTVTNWFLQAEPNLTIVDLVPDRPYRGDWVELIGQAAARSSVMASFLGEGLSASTVSDDTGRFVLNVLCPDHDDATPSTDDAGSFGLEILSGSQRKVVTVPLALPPTAVRSGWPLYR